jgi:Glycosyl transferases group 1
VPQKADHFSLVRPTEGKLGEPMISPCRIAFVGQPEFFQVCYETDLDDLYEVGAFPVRFSPARVMEADSSTMQDLLSFRPDITIFFRGEYASRELVAALSGIKVAFSTEPFPKLIAGKFHYTLDSINRFKAFLRTAERSFDYVFHYDEASQRFIELMGIRLSGYQPLPVATQIWRPPSDPPEKQWDIVFIGRSTEHRERFFGPLKRDLKFLHISHGVHGTDAIAHYTAARIALNIHAEPELSWESRVQTIMACGVLVASEPLSPNPFLVPGEHYVEASSPAKLYDKCRYILSHEQEFDRVRTEAREVVDNRLSSRAVFPAMITACATGRVPRPAYALHRVRLAPLEVCAEYKGFEHLLDQLANEYA